MKKLNWQSEWVTRYWYPFFILLAFVLFLKHPDLQKANRQTLGYYLSGPIYQTFIVLSMSILLHPPARSRWDHWTGWWALDIALCNTLLSHSMKLAIQAPRPFPSKSLTGFPSGHTMLSFALAFLVMQRYPRLAPLWYGMAVAVGWSRIDTNAHYLYQVLCGALFGTLLAWAVSGGPKGWVGPKGLVFPRVLRKKAAVSPAQA